MGGFPVMIWPVLILVILIVIAIGIYVFWRLPRE
jgi:hypothetical protein